MESIEKQIDVAISRGDTAALGAVLAAHPEMKSLASHVPLLHEAFGRGAREVLAFLLRQGVNPDQSHASHGFDTVLMMAAASGDTDSMDLLLAAGADVNAANDYGETAFSFSVAHNQPQCASILHRAGADVNAILNDGSTAMDWLAPSAGPAFRQWLVGIGCQPGVGFNKL